MSNLTQFESYIDLLKDGLLLINSFRVSNKNTDGVNMGFFLHKYINTINPVLTNIIALTTINNKDIIYNLISAIYNELSICLYNNNDLEKMFLFSLLSLRISSESEVKLDEQRKYQGYGVKKIGHQYTTYNKELVTEMVNYTKQEMGRTEVKDPNEMKDKIIVTMTTCKRLDLFEQTVNSFINCCQDRHLISEFFVVDDNSSDEDRKKMTELYPFIKFGWKAPD